MKINVTLMTIYLWLMIFTYRIFLIVIFFTIIIALNDISFSFSYSLIDFRLPRMHNRQLRNNAKLILRLIPYVVMLDSSFCFIEISWLSFLTNIEHSLPIALVAENTSGVKVPCATFKIRELYFLFILVR